MDYKLTKHSNLCHEYMKNNIIYTSQLTHIEKYYEIIKRILENNYEYTEKKATIEASKNKSCMLTSCEVIKYLSPDMLKNIDHQTGSNVPPVSGLLNNNNKLIDWLVNYHMHLVPLLELDKQKKIRSSDNLLKINNMLYDNPFMPVDIQHYSETHKLYYSEIISDNVKIFLYEPIEKVGKIDPLRIIRICKFMKEIANSNINIELRMFTCPIKKKLRTNLDTMLPIHINSGSTLRGLYINIWRYEEWEKVLIHELVHMLGIDYISDNINNKIKEVLHENFNICGEIRVSEAYTEVIALTLHTIYLSILSGNIENFNNLIQLEINFNLFQCAKILNYLGIQNINDIRDKTKKCIKQKTSAFSYFFIKTALIINPEFIEFIKSNIKLDDRTDEFLELIISSMENNEYIESINYFINLIKKSSNNKDFIYKTMRMTCLQWTNQM